MRKSSCPGSELKLELELEMDGGIVFPTDDVGSDLYVYMLEGRDGVLEHIPHWEKLIWRCKGFS